MNKLEKFKQKYPVQIKLAVHWGEMDAFNHVNNVVYFRYFESARIAYFEVLDMFVTASENNIAPILAQTSCRYKLPLNYPDSITVGSSITEKHSHGFLMEYAIFSHKHQKITTTGTGRVVMLNYTTHEKVAITDELWAKINNLQLKHLN